MAQYKFHPDQVVYVTDDVLFEDRAPRRGRIVRAFVRPGVGKVYVVNFPAHGLVLCQHTVYEHNIQVGDIRDVQKPGWPLSAVYDQLMAEADLGSYRLLLSVNERDALLKVVEAGLPLEESKTKSITRMAHWELIHTGAMSNQDLHLAVMIEYDPAQEDIGDITETVRRAAIRQLLEYDARHDTEMFGWQVHEAMKWVLNNQPTWTDSEDGWATVWLEKAI